MTSCEEAPVGSIALTQQVHQLWDAFCAEPPPRALNPEKKGGSEGHSGCNEGKKAREKTTLASALRCFLLTRDVLSSSAEQNINNL